MLCAWQTVRLPVLLCAGALLAACAHAPAPVEESVVVTRPARPATTAPQRVIPEFHVVGRGETLYSIAFRYGLDFRALAIANGIADPYTIFPGQKLRLRERKGVAVAASGKAASGTVPASGAGTAPANGTPAASVAATVPPVAAETRKPPVVATIVPERSLPQGSSAWQWPVQGKLLSTFNPNVIGPKGIALAGNTGDPVRAARDGRVVYIGSSLVGYGQLVILKHDDVYLSAYAHNSKVLVKEGDAVHAGETIAEMGSSGTDRTQLHFEVRRNGDPIDPLAVLPRP